jgi:hypothetical protein
VLANGKAVLAAHDGRVKGLVGAAVLYDAVGMDAAFMAEGV